MDYHYWFIRNGRKQNDAKYSKVSNIYNRLTGVLYIYNISTHVQITIIKLRVLYLEIKMFKNIKPYFCILKKSKIFNVLYKYIK